ncbi:MAG: hypothetical protein QG549_768 [Patescibacteria group bacterium]|nr:hypothetical protein [Patescibacteria group bacterium]
MKRIRHFILTTFIALFGLAATPFVATTSAVDVFKDACSGNPTAVCGASTRDQLPDIVKNVINLLFFVIGIIAVIMIIIGGIRYSTSNGDSSQIQSAKNTVLYAVIGLVVAILAFAIVNFVLGWFK